MGHRLRHRGPIWLLGIILSMVFAHAAILMWQGQSISLETLPPGCVSLAKLQAGKLWTLVTHLWVHQDGWHLVTNLLMLYLLGRRVEQQIGGALLFGTFVAAGVGGALLQMAGSGGHIALAGCSGAVMGILLLSSQIDGHRNVLARLGRGFLSFKNLALGLLLSNAILAILSHLLVNQTEAWAQHITKVAWLSHTGGGLVGLGLGLWLKQSRERDNMAEWHHPIGLRNSQPATDYMPLLTLREAAAQEGEEWKSAGNEERLVPNPVGATFQERVDKVLDRLSLVGLEGLTAKEKALLDEAASRLKGSSPQ
jgi:membrane associated rhomboid family serine protease